MVLYIFEVVHDGQTQNCLSIKNSHLETLLSLPLPLSVYLYFPIINTFLKTECFEMEGKPNFTSDILFLRFEDIKCCICVYSYL